MYTPTFWLLLLFSVTLAQWRDTQRSLELRRRVQAAAMGAVSDTEDVNLHKRDCNGEHCFTTKPISFQKWDRYKAITRLMHLQYCNMTCLSNWTCGASVDETSPIKNTHIYKAYQSGDDIAGGYMGVSHDLKVVFLTFKGARHNQQFIRTLQHIQDDLKGDMKVHRKYCAFFNCTRR